VNALSIIVHSYLQFGKEIDQGLQHFVGFLWQGDLVLFFPSMIKFTCVYVCYHLSFLA